MAIQLLYGASSFLTAVCVAPEFAVGSSWGDLTDVENQSPTAAGTPPLRETPRRGGFTVS